MSDLPASTKGDEPENSAAQWLARRDHGLTLAEEREFAAWRAADARNEAAWQEIAEAWAMFDQPQQTGEAKEMVAELAARRRRRSFRTILTMTGGLAAAACLAVVAWNRPALTPAAVATASSGVLSKPLSQTLPDGSVVDLNKEAEIVVDFTAARRGVRLVRGEAHFSVTKNPARPFVVMVGAVEVRAVGTAFAVKLNAAAVDVVVTEGRVAVDRPPVSAAVPEAVLIGKGDHLSVPTSPDIAMAPLAQALPAAEIDRLLAWREARLELSGTPLREAVALLNQESRVRIEIDDSELAAMRISGVFRADNAEGFAHILEAHYGAVMERRGEHTLVLRKAR